MKKTIALCAVAMLAASPAFANMGHKGKKSFHELDANRDGVVSKAEAASPKFDRKDMDNDGVITKAEWDAYRSSTSPLDMNGNRASKPGGPGAPKI